MIELHRILRETLDLEPLSESASRLAGLVVDDEIDLDEVARVVRLDPALSTQALRAANSASSGSFAAIETVEGAVVRLGPSWVLSMALGSTVQERLEQPLPQYGLAEGQLWRHSIAASLAAEELKRFARTRVPAVAATAALLHDIGKLVLARHLRRHLLLDMQRAALRDGLTGLRAESRVLRINHAELGGMVARHWQLPEPIAQGITHHHHPGDAKDAELRSLVHSVHVADVAASLALEGADRLYLSVDELTDSLAFLELPPERLRSLCEVVRTRTDEVLATYA